MYIGLDRQTNKQVWLFCPVRIRAHTPMVTHADCPVGQQRDARPSTCIKCNAKCFKPAVANMQGSSSAA